MSAIVPSDDEIRRQAWEDSVIEVLSLCDAFEHIATKSKAKNANALTLRAMKKLRDRLVEMKLDDQKVTS